MLSIPSLFSILLLPLITAQRISVPVTDQGFVVEFEDDAPTATPEFYQEIINCTNHLLDSPTISPRIEFQSPFFRGTSFNISGSTTSSTISATQIQNEIGALKKVKQIWPIQRYHLNSAVPLPAQWGARDEERKTSARHVQGAVDYGLSFQEDNTTTPFAVHVQTGVDRLHKEGITGKGVKVAIMDTGIDYLHPALGAGFGEGHKVAFGYDFVGDAYTSFGANRVGIEDADPYSECNVHGTHVAGILGADPTAFGLVGVAPDATLNIYRVFGCNSSSITTDTGIDAMLRIHEFGADIISASLGGDGGWSQDPWAVVAERINANGTLFVLSNGNNGFAGPFSGGSPATAIDVLAVGNAYSIDTMMYTWNGTFSANGEDEEFIFTPGYPADFPSGLTLASLSSEVADNACAPLTTNISNPDQTAVLVNQGSCYFDLKFDNLKAAGAKYVILYDADPSPGSGIIYNDFHPFDAFATVKNELGVYWLSLLGAGTEVQVSLASLATAKKQVFSEPNYVTGGRMSADSSWGPTFEGAIKPVVTAPGGSMLSTLPRSKGSYGVLSGTSMSAPYLAGVAALMKQANPALTPHMISNILATTAKPMLFNDNSSTPYDFLAPVFQQGGGLVDAYQAVRTKAVLNVTSLAFNDTDNQPSSLSFTIKNIGEKATTFSLSNIGAASLYALKGDGDTYPVRTDHGDLKAGLIAAYADLSITPSTVTVGPGDSQTISVSVKVPDLDKARLPLYSGFLAINATDGSQSLTVPYAGIATSLKEVMVLDPKRNNQALRQYDWSAGVDKIVAANTLFTLRLNNGSAATNDDSVYPAVNFILSLGTRYLDMDIIYAENDTSATSMTDGPVIAGRDLSNIWSWDGTDVDAITPLPAGAYRWRVRALRLSGNSSNPDDFDTIITDPFSIQYINSPSLTPSRKNRRGKV